MNNNFKFLLCGAAVWLFPQYAAAQCAITDCQQLGYTSLKSCESGLKCPFGEYWACPKAEEKAVLGECTGYAKNCKIGQILNSDGTCTSDKISGKNPLGVVIAIKDNCGWAITASPVATNIAWSTEKNLAGFGFTKDWTIINENYEACTITHGIIEQGNSIKYPAAWAAVNYEPSTAPATKGKWCLPAPGMLNNYHIALTSAINNAISKIGGTQIGNTEMIWLTTEASLDAAWFFSSNSSYYGSAGLHYGNKNMSGEFNTVRPVIAF